MTDRSLSVPLCANPEAVDALQTIRDCLRYALTQMESGAVFFGHGSLSAWDEAAYLLTWQLKLPLEQLDTLLDARLLPSERQAFLKLLDRRIGERLPAPYLTHEAWLTGQRFYVDQRVIVPRSFIAELLEEQCAPWIEEPESVHRVLDLCTGSGCLAILAALAFPEARVDGVDLSTDALAVARRNVQDYGIEDRVELLHSDLYGALEGRRYDLILSNPPYVNAESMASLPAEYQAEPEMALAGGVDGLDLVHTILREAGRHLTDNGLLIVEIGHNRDDLEAAYPELPFIWLETASGNEFVFLLHAADLPFRA